MQQSIVAQSDVFLKIRNVLGSVSVKNAQIVSLRKGREGVEKSGRGTLILLLLLKKTSNQNPLYNIDFAGLIRCLCTIIQTDRSIWLTANSFFFRSIPSTFLSKKKIGSLDYIHFLFLVYCLLQTALTVYFHNLWTCRF